MVAALHTAPAAPPDAAREAPLGELQSIERGRYPLSSSAGHQPAGCLGRHVLGGSFDVAGSGTKQRRYRPQVRLAQSCRQATLRARQLLPPALHLSSRSCAVRRGHSQ